MSRYKTQIKFWENLKTGFDYFEKNHKLPKVEVDQNTGLYLFNN